MVDDVGELLVEQADVERVQHRPDARDREVELEVALVVPGERPDPVALLDAEPAERAREPVDPLGDLGEGGRLDDPRLRSVATLASGLR